MRAMARAPLLNEGPTLKSNATMNRNGRSPQRSPQIRPYVVTSKPANASTQEQILFSALIPRASRKITNARPFCRRLAETGRRIGQRRDATRAPIPGPNPAEAGRARLRSRSEAKTRGQGRQESVKSWGRRGKAPALCAYEHGLSSSTAVVFVRQLRGPHLST